MNAPPAAHHTPPAPAPAEPARAHTQPHSRAHPRTFDGIICFGGEDWWYHNRGHYDMQMMRELSRAVPVLYVNSIGMRVPRVGEGKMFFKRVRRKLKSLRRGLVRVRDNFAVFSPLAAPGALGSAVTKSFMPAQVRLAARRLGIRKPLVWINCPPGAQAVGKLGEVALVYQRTDKYEHFTGVDENQIRAYDRFLKDRADLTLYCSRALFDEERTACRAAAYIDHGVDFHAFALAGSNPAAAPADAAALPRPLVGFIGGIDKHTFDPPLMVEVARQLPDVHFMLVGGSTLPPEWCTLPNVHRLGQRPYESVPGYMAACDVLIMPWNNSDWIKHCNPIKLKEYLAVGRPVVSTPFDELARYEGFVRVASTPQAFAQAIRDGLADPARQSAQAIDRLRDRVREHTWDQKARAALALLAADNVQPSSPLPAPLVPTNAPADTRPS